MDDTVYTYVCIKTGYKIWDLFIASARKTFNCKFVDGEIDPRFLNLSFPIDLEPNGLPFGAKLIGKSVITN